MKTTHILHTSILTLLLGASTVLAEPPAAAPAAEKAPTTKQTPAAAQTVPEAQPAEIIIVEEENYFAPDEARTQLSTAAKAVAEKDWKTAGIALRKVDFFLQAEAIGAPADASAALNAAAQQLSSVAKDLENGVMRPDESITHAITGAYASLAQEHYLQAAEKRTAGDWKGAKRELYNAAQAVESKLTSSGTAIDAETQTLLNVCRKITAATDANADLAKSAVGQLIDALGQKMEHLGMAMQKHS